MTALPSPQRVADPLTHLLSRPQVRAGALAMARICARDSLKVGDARDHLASGASLQRARNTQLESRTMLRSYLLGAADASGLDVTVAEARQLADQLEAGVARGDL